MSLAFASILADRADDAPFMLTKNQLVVSRFFYTCVRFRYDSCPSSSSIQKRTAEFQFTVMSSENEAKNDKRELCTQRLFP